MIQSKYCTLGSKLTLCSLAGIVYKTWITPVKNTTLHNTRTGLGGFSDRVGAVAYALTPLTVALSTRESILTLATGIPYQSSNFLHRWLGRVIFIQSFLHTLGWTLIEGEFYQPQPTVYTEFIKQPYMIWGCVAMLFITFLYIFSLRRVIKWTGYEFFKKTHYVVAMLYLGACWGHWSKLACWMIASLALWGIDRGIRLLRVLLIHIGYINSSSGFRFHPAQSSVKYFDDEDGGVVRLDFDHNHDIWKVGQHFFLCFPALTIWQSHPLTVASVPGAHPSIPHHVYIIRCRSGETRRLKALALTNASEVASQELGQSENATTPVILCGPYGTPLLPSSGDVTNILAIAGGTGVSLTLPVVLAATSSLAMSGAAIDFVWIIRRFSNMDWITAELNELKRRSSKKAVNLNIHIIITQEHDPKTFGSQQTHSQHEDKAKEVGNKPVTTETESLSSRSEKDFETPNTTISYLNSRHPSLQDIVSGFIGTRASFEHRTKVIASGPAGIGHDLRAAVAGLNDGGKVWKGEKKWDVDLHWDDRMG
jgi:predicted ferric reductase